jgi:MFS family permease
LLPAAKAQESIVNTDLINKSDAVILPDSTPFWGLRIIVAAALINACSNALLAGYSVFLPQIEAEFSAGRATTSMGLAILITVQGLSAPLIGRLIDRRSLITIMNSGVIMAVLGLMLMSLSSSLWQLVILIGTLVAVGKYLFGQVPTSVMASNWYIKRRTLALSVATAGVTISSVIIPPVATWLIEQWGWRIAVQVIAVGVAVVALPLIQFFVIKRPEEVGQFPDGNSSAAANDTKSSEPSAYRLTVSELIRDRNFWLLAVIISSCFGMMVVVAINLYPFVSQQGVGTQQASYVISCMALFMLVGQFVMGALADHIDKRHALCIAFAVEALAMLLLTNDLNYRLTMFASAVAGFGLGAMIPVPYALIVRVYGRAAFSQVYGDMHIAMLPISFFLPPIFGHIYDVTGSYRVLFLSLVGVLVLLVVLTLLVKIPEREPGTSQ